MASISLLLDDNSTKKGTKEVAVSDLEVLPKTTTKKKKPKKPRKKRPRDGSTSTSVSKKKCAIGEHSVPRLASCVEWSETSTNGSSLQTTRRSMRARRPPPTSPSRNFFSLQRMTGACLKMRWRIT